MYKLLGVAVAIVVLGAAACPGSSGTTTLAVTGATFSLRDSVTHGGGDLKIAQTVDTAIVAVTPTLTSPAASSGSTNGSARDACLINVQHDPTQSPQVYTVIVSCDKK